MSENVLLYLNSIIMGIVEGITEFLPISSTGHLIITGDVLKFPKEFGETFEVVIQLGAILAVIYYYRTKILDSLKSVSKTLTDACSEFKKSGNDFGIITKMYKNGEWGYKLWINMLVAFIPSATVGLLAHKYIKSMFSPLVVAWAMIVGAILLFLVQKRYIANKNKSIESATLKDSFTIGVFQCLSLIPGMSRSASTIMGGMVSGFNAKGAAEFSFFLAIPTMFAATFYELLKGLGAMNYSEIIALAIGFVVSFIVAFVVVGKFLDYLGKRSLNVFVYYRLVVGVLLLFLIKYGVINA